MKSNLHANSYFAQLALILFAAITMAESNSGTPIPLSQLTYSDRTGFFLLNALRVDPISYFSNYGQDVKTASSCAASVRDESLKPLLWDPELQRASNFHAHSMRTNNHFDHDTSPSDCSKNFHDDCRMIRRVSSFTDLTGKEVAENIHCYKGGDSNAFEAMRAFLESKEHCKTMIDPSYKAGSVARDGSYWAQNFISSPSQGSLQIVQSESVGILVGTHVQGSDDKNLHFVLVYMHAEPLKAAKVSFLARDDSKQEAELKIVYGNREKTVAVLQAIVPMANLQKCSYYYFQVVDPGPVMRYPAGRGVLMTYGIQGCLENYGELHESPSSSSLSFEKRDVTTVQQTSLAPVLSSSVGNGLHQTMITGMSKPQGITMLQDPNHQMRPLPMSSSPAMRPSAMSSLPPNFGPAVSTGPVGNTFQSGSNSNTNNHQAGSTTLIAGTAPDSTKPMNGGIPIEAPLNLNPSMQPSGGANVSHSTPSSPIQPVSGPNVSHSTTPSPIKPGANLPSPNAPDALPISKSSPVTEVVSEEDDSKKILFALLGVFIPILCFLTFLIARKLAKPKKPSPSPTASIRRPSKSAYYLKPRQ